VVAAVVVGGTSIFGGRGSVGRTLAGILLLAVLGNGMDLKGVGPDLQNAILGSVLILAASADFFRRALSRRRLRAEPVTGAPPGGDAAPATARPPLTERPVTTQAASTSTEVSS
jgi:ribose transport system permease protein